jgi:FtsZ-interacting cell division protein ZipA
MNETTWVIIGGVIVIIALIAGALAVRKRNSERLKSRFGAEYTRAVNDIGNQRDAEAELRDREKRVKEFEIKPLEPGEKTRFEESWRAVQTQFVDNPGQAVTEADQLLGKVMSARGYPLTDFEQRSADVSVNHPEVVQNYRKAHDIVERHGEGQAGTEELRQAMVLYRSLFVELVGEGQSRPEATAAVDHDVEQPRTAQGR